MPKYTLELNESQVDVLSKATEIVSRLYMGQMDVLMELVEDMSFEDAQRLKKEVFPSLTDNGSFHGIRSVKIPDTARKLYDIHQVLRHLRAKENNAPSISVHHQKPHSYSTECGLPKLKRVKDGKDPKVD